MSSKRCCLRDVGQIIEWKEGKVEDRKAVKLYKIKYEYFGHIFLTLQVHIKIWVFYKMPHVFGETLGVCEWGSIEDPTCITRMNPEPLSQSLPIHHIHFPRPQTCQCFMLNFLNIHSTNSTGIGSFSHSMSSNLFIFLRNTWWLSISSIRNFRGNSIS